MVNGRAIYQNQQSTWGTKCPVRSRTGTSWEPSPTDIGLIFQKFICKHKLRQYRTINGWRLCRTSACRFSVISHKNLLTYASMPAKFLCNLTKNLTAHLHDNNCAVLPYLYSYHNCWPNQLCQPNNPEKAPDLLFQTQRYCHHHRKGLYQPYKNSSEK